MNNFLIYSKKAIRAQEEGKYSIAYNLLCELLEKNGLNKKTKIKIELRKAECLLYSGNSTACWEHLDKISGSYEDSAKSLLQIGNFYSHIAEYKKADELSDGDPLPVSSLACCYYLLGENQKAEYHYGRLEKRLKKEYVPPVLLYSYHLIRGDIDRAFEWFTEAIKEHDSYLIYLTICPTKGHQIPDEPRFNKLIRKVGLGNLEKISL